MTTTLVDRAVRPLLPVHRLDAMAAEAFFARRADGRVRLAHEGGWCFGAIDLDDGGDLQAAAQHAYGMLFAALRDAAPLRLLRLWNVLPRIHHDEAGLERYRRFNAGRQQAFIDAGEAAFEGAPAACALGRDGGPLSVRWAAAPVASRALENPRQVPAWRYDTRFGPRSPTFSRAVVADAGGGREVLFVSGTASIVGQESLHDGDIVAQTQETLANLRAVLAEAGPRFALGALQATVYLRDAADRATVQPLLAAAGVRPMAWLRADVCRRELLVEIEGHAVA